MQRPHVTAPLGQFRQRGEDAGALPVDGAGGDDGGRALQRFEEPRGDQGLRALVRGDRGARVACEGAQHQGEGGQARQHAGRHPQVDEGQCPEGAQRSDQ